MISWLCLILMSMCGLCCWVRRVRAFENCPSSYMAHESSLVFYHYTLYLLQCTILTPWRRWGSGWLQHLSTGRTDQPQESGISYSPHSCSAWLHHHTKPTEFNWHLQRCLRSCFQWGSPRLFSCECAMCHGIAGKEGGGFHILVMKKMEDEAKFCL